MSRLLWGASVLFMPEAMPAAAIHQLLDAGRLQSRLHSIRGWDSWALEQSFLVVKGGVKDRDSGGILTADGLVYLAEQCQQKHGTGIHIGMLPRKDDIGRRSKKSLLEKIIAGGQTLWFSTNIISRLVDGKQVTLLEDITMAYAFCGLISMIAWFRCPQDVEDPFEVDLKGIGPLTGRTQIGPCNLEVLMKRCMSGLVIVSLLIVTGVHLGAWQYPFPTAAEAWIWRSCALITLPLGCLIVYFRNRNVFLASCTGLILARLALCTVACTAFRRMPVSAFDTPDWSDYWGHIGR
jgi:hypothetical protein